MTLTGGLGPQPWEVGQEVLPMTPLWGGLSPQPWESRVWKCPRGTLFMGSVGPQPLGAPVGTPHGAGAWAPSPGRGGLEESLHPHGAAWVPSPGGAGQVHSRHTVDANG